MADKTITVRYFTVEATRPNGAKAILARVDWQNLITNLVGIQNAGNFSSVKLGSQEFQVGVLKSSTTGSEAIYVGRVRSGMSAPLTSGAAGAGITSIIPPAGKAIVEPGVLMPVASSGRGVIGYFRSGYGPAPSVIETVLDEVVHKNLGRQNTHVMLPLFGQNMKALIAGISTVSKLEVKVDFGNAQVAANPSSPIEQALAGLQSNTVGDVTANLELSYGNTMPQGPGFMLSMKRLMSMTGLMKLKATTKTPDPNAANGFRTDHLDLIKDHITIQQKMISKSGTIDSDIILGAMSQAERKLIVQSSGPNSRVKI